MSKGFYFTSDVAFTIHDPLSNTELEGSDVLRGSTDKRIESPVICEGDDIYQLFNVCIDTSSYEEYGFGEEIQIVATDTRSNKVLYRAYLNPQFLTQMRTLATAGSGDAYNDEDVPWASSSYEDYSSGEYYDEGEFAGDVYPMDDGSFHIDPYDDTPTRHLAGHPTPVGSNAREQRDLLERLRAASRVAWLRYEMDEPLVLDFLQSASGCVYLRRVSYTFDASSLSPPSRIVVNTHDATVGVQRAAEIARQHAAASLETTCAFQALSPPLAAAAQTNFYEVAQRNAPERPSTRDENLVAVQKRRRRQLTTCRASESSLPHIVRDFSRLKIK